MTDHFGSASVGFQDSVAPGANPLHRLNLVVVTYGTARPRHHTLRVPFQSSELSKDRLWVRLMAYLRHLLSGWHSRGWAK